MASPAHKLRFVLFPLMAQGHMMPMINIAKLLAQRGVIITIFTTTHNAARFHTSIARPVESGLMRIQVIQLQFPYEEAGIPKGCDNLDKLSSLGLVTNFLTSTSMQRHPVEKLFEELTPPPNCIISDMCLPWTHDIACKFQIPRFSFLGCGCFCLFIFHILGVHNVHAKISSKSEYFVLPGLPDHIEFTKSQLPSPGDPKMKEFSEQMAAPDLASHGMIVNTFQELEAAYANEYRKARGDKVWCIGPVSLCNKDNIDRAERGNKASIEEHQCLKWLVAQEHFSVIYACLGSLCNLIPSQLIELGLALEESNKPFIWALRGAESSEELKKWILEDRYEERMKGRGLLIWGWAPQLLILSHPPVGGFLKHCGWNSCIEGKVLGCQLILLAWPLFADQFMNEKLVVQVQKIGVRVGVEDPINWGVEEKTGVLVKKEDVKGAIERLMSEGEEREVRRRKARELGEMAKRAVEDGGYSHMEMTLLIRHIMLLLEEEN